MTLPPLSFSCEHGRDTGIQETKVNDETNLIDGNHLQTGEIVNGKEKADISIPSFLPMIANVLLDTTEYCAYTDYTWKK